MPLRQRGGQPIPLLRPHLWRLRRQPSGLRQHLRHSSLSPHPPKWIPSHRDDDDGEEEVVEVDDNDETTTRRRPPLLLLLLPTLLLPGGSTRPVPPRCRRWGGGRVAAAATTTRTTWRCCTGGGWTSATPTPTAPMRWRGVVIDKLIPSLFSVDIIIFTSTKSEHSDLPWCEPITPLFSEIVRLSEAKKHAC